MRRRRIRDRQNSGGDPRFQTEVPETTQTRAGLVSGLPTHGYTVPSGPTQTPNIFTSGKGKPNMNPGEGRVRRDEKQRPSSVLLDHSSVNSARSAVNRFQACLHLAHMELPCPLVPAETPGAVGGPQVIG